MNIVYVEDNFANLALVERVATMWHHQVINFTSAEEALDSLDDLDTTLLLVDIKLDGEMDGVEFITALRKEGVTLPIVVITAYDTSQQKARCFAAGCDAYFTKPIPVAELKKVIEQFSA